MKSDNPVVSVVLPVYNGEAYLRESLRSLLKQTIADFEIVVIDDGSTDESAAIAESFNDPRIRVLHNGSNRGLIYSLNRGLEEASGTYIARMDHDDVADRNRLVVQLRFMERNPTIGLCGTWIRHFGDGRGIVKLPTHPQLISVTLLFKNCIVHPTVLMRKEFLDGHALRYEEGFPNCEDYELWSRCSLRFPVANLPKPLLRYRLHSGSVTDTVWQSGREERFQALLTIHENQFSGMQIPITSEELHLHTLTGEPRFIDISDAADPIGFLEKAKQWLDHLSERLRSLYSEAAINSAFSEAWFNLCYSLLARDRRNVFELYKKSGWTEAAGSKTISLSDRLKMFFRRYCRFM